MDFPMDFRDQKKSDEKHGETKRSEWSEWSEWAACCPHQTCAAFRVAALYMGTAPRLPGEDVMDFFQKNLQNQKPLADAGWILRSSMFIGPHLDFLHSPHLTQRPTHGEHGPERPQNDDISALHHSTAIAPAPAKKLTEWERVNPTAAEMWCRHRGCYVDVTEVDRHSIPQWSWAKMQVRSSEKVLQVICRSCM